jgi:hypothetical protein
MPLAVTVLEQGERGPLRQRSPRKPVRIRTDINVIDNLQIMHIQNDHSVV